MTDKNNLLPKNIEFQTLAEDAPVMLWLTNIDGQMIFTNSRWKKFVGGDKVDKEGGNAWYESLHPDDRERSVQTFRDAFVNHRPFEMEYRLKRGDGEYRHMLDNGEPYISETGVFSGFIGSSTDITEQKHFEAQLKHSHNEMESHNSEMRLVNKLNSYLQICRTLEETYPVILYYAKELFPNCTGSIYLFNNTRTVVESVVSWGPNKDSQIPVITPDDCWSLRQGKPHTVNDSVHGLLCHHLKGYPEHGYTCVPIIAQGDMVGMINLQFPKLDEHLAPDEVAQKIEAKRRLVNMTADNLALALVSLKLREALKTQSIKDPLTKLFNRRYMEETLEREHSRCKRANISLGVIMVDIDHFKNYNDEYGHDVGDKILSEIGAVLQNKLRKSDIPCRYGGEEFILILPGAEVDILEQRAEEIRHTIDTLVIHYKNDVFADVTASFGVAAIPKHASSQEDLIKAADDALYQAKKSGRNMIVVAHEFKNKVKASKVKSTAEFQQAVNA